MLGVIKLIAFRQITPDTDIYSIGIASDTAFIISAANFIDLDMPLKLGGCVGFGLECQQRDCALQLEPKRDRTAT